MVKKGQKDDKSALQEGGLSDLPPALDVTNGQDLRGRSPQPSGKQKT
jgi:hypothetical protein